MNKKNILSPVLLFLIFIPLCEVLALKAYKVHIRTDVLLRRTKATAEAILDKGMILALQAGINKALGNFNEVDWSKVIEGEKLVYFFGDEDTEGNRDMKGLLGGKGANLAEMANLGLPVPYGFTITTRVTDYYYRIKALKEAIRQIDTQPESVREALSGEIENLGKAEQLIARYEEKLQAEILAGLKKLEEKMGRALSGEGMPLLLSVRSGARVSMPGMMDTILNLGLNDNSVETLAKATGDRRFAYDCYRRFIQIYAGVALEANEERFNQILTNYMEEKGYGADESKLTEEDEVLLTGMYKEELNIQGYTIPSDPLTQLYAAIEAVYRSSKSPRSLHYRQMEGIPLETSLSAVNIQVMVYGNLGDNSGTAVVFTHNLNTGEHILTGEFLPKAQGEDVVAGRRKGLALQSPDDRKALQALFPGLYGQIEQIVDVLFKHYKEAQDMEITVENGKLWMLQTRTAKRAPEAAIRIAVELVNLGLRSKEEAVMSFGRPDTLATLLAPQFDPVEKEVKKNDLLTKGLSGSPGGAVGKVVFSKEDAAELAKRGEKVILVREETSPDDIAGIDAAQGVLTTKGGATSHAVLVARGAGKPAVPGASDIRINFQDDTMTVGGKTVRKGDYISIDGSTGEVFVGIIPTIDSLILRAQRGEKLSKEESAFYQDYVLFMSWADQIREGVLGVRTNAEKSDEVEQGVKHRAEGIGLARTEHMFREHVDIFQRVILAETAEAREKILTEELLPLQQKYFEDIFTITEGKPDVIRLLDPPLHEFLPSLEEGNKIRELALKLELSENVIRTKIAALKEENPMFGFRGVRLLIAYPELVRMQTRAIFNAAKSVANAKPQIMIPLVSVAREFEIVSNIIDEVAQKEFGLARGKDYKVGTMIELVGGALNAGEIAKVADFFSFGTNDLTQGTDMLSRDDAGVHIIPVYTKDSILETDPFVSVDSTVAQLISFAVQAGRAANPNLSIGVCGEQGVDPYSIMKYLAACGLDYVSGGASRIPLARLAAAQAAILLSRGELQPIRTDFDDSNVGELGKISIIPTDDSFSGSANIQAARELILDKNSRSLLPSQVDYYTRILQENSGSTTTLQLLDSSIKAFFQGVEDSDILKKVKPYLEANPDLGNKGPRQAVATHPQIYRTQIEAIFTAASGQIKQGKNVDLRILVPFVMNAREFGVVKDMIVEIASMVSKQEGVNLDYKVGAMIGIPSAALDAGNLAGMADFLVMDAKGLTEATFGMFEEDAPQFLPLYLNEGIFENNPFEVLHPTVQRLINIAVNKARAVKSGVDVFLTSLEP